MGYEAAVEKLLHPGESRRLPDDVIRRLQVELYDMEDVGNAVAPWLYRMITTDNPLEEKITLFWHGLFATGFSNTNNPRSLFHQIDMFQRKGLGSFRDLLVALAKDPAMIVWLNNNDNHRGATNENFARELLELFSMGVGNYSEQDVKECARAFTGWTLGNAEYMAVRAHKGSSWPYGRIAWYFEYRPDDHDDGLKTFLGETGRFNGEDIVDIITRRPSTARFLSRRLFQFFAADDVDREGEHCIEALVQSYFDSGNEIRSMLRTLFRSSYFKSERARFARVKGPVELVVGAIRLAGGCRSPTPAIGQVGAAAYYMGQGLLRPPSVEGWHEGTEWIDSGSLMERVNFVAGELGNVNLPGVRFIIGRLSGRNGGKLSPDQLVDGCLDLLGPIWVSPETRSALVEHVAERGDVDLRQHRQGDESELRVAEVLGLMASTREFQLA